VAKSKTKVVKHYKKHSWFIVELETGGTLRTCQQDEYNKVVEDGFLDINNCLYWCVF
jgi:hypothetical protein